jgi:hypothetical protein
MLAGIHVPVAPARVKFVLADLWLIIRPLVGTLAQAKTHARVRVNVRQRYRQVRARATQRKAPRAARGQRRRGIEHKRKRGLCMSPGESERLLPWRASSRGKGGSVPPAAAGAAKQNTRVFASLRSPCPRGGVRRCASWWASSQRIRVG